MAYAIKELFYSLQGEGFHSGRAAVFCRFSGCNLWSGHEDDRASAICRMCDADFLGIDGPGGGYYETADSLAAKVAMAWDAGSGGEAKPFVVLTGGEPMLQVDDSLIAALRELEAEIAVETNGTLPVGDVFDWVCVSPKAGARLAVTHGNELKLVFPQDGAAPDLYEGLDFENLYLQPLQGHEGAANTAAAIEYCLGHPRWRLSVQVHKLVGVR